MIIFNLNGCGYSPVYLNTSGADFEIVTLELKGNNKINRIVESKLKQHLNNNSEKKYNLRIKTEYKKISAAKDATGNTTNFKLITKLVLNYEKVDPKLKDLEKTVSLSESLTIKKNENYYEQNIYEKIVIKNMSELLVERLTLHLSRN